MPRWVYDRLRLRGTIRLDPAGIKLGQRHHFDVELSAVVPITESVSNFKNKLHVYPAAVRFLRQHLLGEAAARDALVGAELRPGLS
jgi:hypothetical protein